MSLFIFKFSGEVMIVVINDNKLYFVSGWGVFFKEGVVYDFVIDLWLDMVLGLKRGWIGLCVVVNGRFYLLEILVGRLKVYVLEKDDWDVIMEDVRLGNLEMFVGVKGKIVFIVGLGMDI